MDENPKWVASDPKEEVAQAGDEFGPPIVSRIHHTIQFAGAGGRKTHQRFHIVVTADHAIEGDDIVLPNGIGQLNEVAVSDLYLLAPASFPCLIFGRPGKCR